jgi:hypothetical protein
MIAYSRGDEGAVAKVNELLVASGQTVEDLVANKISAKIERLSALERLDGLIAIAEARRNNALHEILRHRQSLGETVRQNLLAIEHNKDEVTEAAPAHEESAT